MCNFFIEKKGKDVARVRCHKHKGYEGNERYCPTFDKNKYICPTGGDTILKQELLEQEGYGVLYGAI